MLYTPGDDRFARKVISLIHIVNSRFLVRDFKLFFQKIIFFININSEVWIFNELSLEVEICP
jgi:hypothetical protein